MIVADYINMTSTTVVPSAFLQELRYFTRTLPQQYRVAQSEQIKKAKPSMVQKEIQKNKKLVEPKPEPISQKRKDEEANEEL